MPRRGPPRSVQEILDLRQFGNWWDSQLVANDEVVTAGDQVVTAGYVAADVVVTAAFTAADAAHVAAADPHAGYVLESTLLNGSAVYDPPNLADGATTTTSVTVAGAALGDFALASFSLDLQGILVTAYVSAADTVTVVFQNETTGALNLGSGTLRARVWKQ